MQKYWSASTLCFLLCGTATAQTATTKDAAVRPAAAAPSTAASAPRPMAPRAKAKMTPAEMQKDIERITEISVQRSSGGPPPADFDDALVTLRPEADKSWYGSGSFYRLAYWLKSKGFFEMKESYRNVSASDCGGTLITVTRDGKRKTSFLGCYTGADQAEIQLKFYEMEMVIRGVAAEIERATKKRAGARRN